MIILWRTKFMFIGSQVTSQNSLIQYSVYQPLLGVANTHTAQVVWSSSSSNAVQFVVRVRDVGNNLADIPVS